MMIFSGIFLKISAMAVVVLVAFMHQAINPPPPRLCGAADGPPISAPRIKLKDGRFLAYQESGVPKDEAKYKIIFSHGFDSCRHHALPVSPSTLEEMQIYFLSFDRAGYCESSPNPHQSVKSAAFDIQELADQMKLGEKFYVGGMSMGGYAVWGCLKYIPHRLAGAVLLVPVVNYWWPSFPKKLSIEAYNQQLPQDQWTLRVVHHLPWLTYWWMTQKWFPSSSVASRDVRILSPHDFELVQKLQEMRPLQDVQNQTRQQGVYESICRDINVGFGKWEFDPMEINNPFPDGDGSVHIWQGDEDRLVPVSLQRYVARKLPWIQYHEVQGSGHLFPLAHSFSDTILKVLLQGGEAATNIHQV